MSQLQSPDPSLFFSRRDPTDPRLGELAQQGSPDSAVSIIGYRDDEGIQLNGGRTGAADGPVEIRRWLYRQTLHPLRRTKIFNDLGDLMPHRLSLSDRHELARQTVASELKASRQVLTLGGGNDYAYSDGMALLDTSQGQRPLIINVDAHLDVRPTDRGLTSGTPFYRLLESGKEFDFVELGIQAQCNSKSHWDYAQNKKAKIISMEQIMASGRPLHAFVIDQMGDWVLRSRPTFVAIDMDAFAWPFATGTSAAWPLGLQPESFAPLLATLFQRLDVRVLGIYETSPALDTGGGTARLAAQLAHGFLHV